MNVIVVAVLAGLGAGAAGTLPWALLVKWNTEHGSTVPWAVPIMAVYLWAYWRYVRGAGWPQSTSKARRATSRVNPLSADQWSLALVAGALGIGSVILFQGVLGRLVRLPQQEDLDVSLYPVATVASWLLMSAAVSGVVEETAYRGFLQRPIECRHGPVVAILTTGLVFGLSHFTHPEVTVVLLPFYMGVAAVYGGLAYLTDSTLPGMMLHAGGNALGFLNLVTSGQSEWAMSAGPQPLIWQTGVDASFWVTSAALMIVTTATVWAYSALAGLRRPATSPWLNVPLSDYESHMASPSVGQATLLADVFGATLARLKPGSIAVLGAAGGNGFDRIDPAVTTRIVAIDINQHYLAALSSRLAHRLPGLELRAVDVSGQNLHIEPVEFVFAGLFFEHVDPGRALVTLQHLTAAGATLVTVLQQPGVDQPAASPSPYRGLEPVGAAMRLIESRTFAARAGASGFSLVSSQYMTLPSGKSFAVLEFTRVS